jgi:hypothetical protein
MKQCRAPVARANWVALRFALLALNFDRINRIIRIFSAVNFVNSVLTPLKLAARMPPELAGKMPALRYGRTWTRYIVLVAVGVNK